MGHIRTGFLPRTRQWNAIVEQLSAFDGDADAVRRIANDTLTAIKKTGSSGFSVGNPCQELAG